MSNEVGGRLSSRVLNMKFMKQAESTEELAKEEEETRSLIDSSEWKLSDRRKIASRLAPKIRNVGYAGVMAKNDQGGFVGRRKFGEAKDADDVKTTTPKRSADQDLDKLWESHRESHRDQNKNKKHVRSDSAENDAQPEPDSSHETPAKRFRKT
ncbi:LAMI_0D08086g1_1 [Lachancea mirantina]|uniref:LAMI_0D08086g1_1 n=1 Tax=Lachancea mirantina TaxID=1230905 RepID=A0A1G4JCS6_9SACH|nr:LAMI_0D08086g1_1 [Lachancea mirantina]